MNDDSILMDNLCCLLNALPFDGRSAVCDPKCHTCSFDDCLDHGEERIDFVLPLLSGLASQAAVMLWLEFMMTSLSFLILSLLQFQVWLTTSIMSIATSTNPMFIATSADASTNHMTVGDYAPMSITSPTVQVSDESEDFGVALTLDMIDVSTTDYVIPKIELDIVEAACVVTSLAIEKEASILPSIVDQVSSLAYKELCNVSRVSDIDSADGNDDILPISPNL